MGVQKAWTKIAESFNSENKQNAINAFYEKRGIDVEIETIPQDAEMKNVIKNSFLNRKMREQFKIYSFLSRAITRITELEKSGIAFLGPEYEWLKSTSWDELSTNEDRQMFILALEQVVIAHPEIEWDVNEVWRT